MKTDRQRYLGWAVLPYMGDAQVGEGLPHSMHFWFAGDDFWIARSWDLASSTGISAAIAKNRLISDEWEG